MKKEMLINVLQPEECRIAIVEDGVLEELYVERANQESYVGNIYKGRIVNIEASIQAAFVDFGIGRNGFLHVSDVAPAYYKHLLSPEDLAEYEAELERQYTGGPEQDSDPPRHRGRGRGRDRSPSAAPSPPRSLRPRTEDFVPPAAPTVEEADDSDFGAGLLEPEEGLASTPRSPADAPHEAFSAASEQPRISKTPRAPQPIPSQEEREASPPPATLSEDDESDFGAGLDLDDSEPLPPEREPSATDLSEEDDESASRADREKAPGPEEAFVEEEASVQEEAAVIYEETSVEKEDSFDESPIDEASEESAPLSDAPRYMESVARRTRQSEEEEVDDGVDADDSPVGEESEQIVPFYEGSSDFDPDAPNDRFTDSGLGEVSAEGEAAYVRFGDEEPETAEASEAEARSIAQEEAGFPVDNDEIVQEEEGSEVETSGARADSWPRGRGRGGRDRGGRGSRDRRGDRGGRDRGGRAGDRRGRTPPRDRGLPRFPIQEIFKRGQEVIVQVIKEGIGTKGPTLSTYISIAGRYLVLMPSLNRVGVSRKIEDPEARRRLRDIMATLNPPKGVGFIVRTAAVDREAKELQTDLAYLLRLWQVVVRRIKRMPSPVEIFRESDMITRTIRDIFSPDIDTIWVDEPNAFAHASEFLQVVMPQFAGRIRYFADTEPLFHKYGIENEIAKINQKRIDLPQGGSIVIEQTEALVAIDVNSGNFRADNDAEETAYRMNLLAAKEIARQLRLRDLGGVIVNDFIDMRREDHRRAVEQALRDALKRDRARTKILRISQFGLIEMTRQRIQPSLRKRIFDDCPHCRGTGYVKTSETLSIDVMRLLQLAAHRSPAVQNVQINVHLDVAHYLLNKKRKEITALEDRARMNIQITGLPGVPPETLDIKCYDQNGNEVRLYPIAAPRLSGGRTPRSADRPDRRYPPALE